MTIRPSTLPCFTPQEKARAHEALAVRVAHMMGRKFEEGDWAYVYCRAKEIPVARWSNLDIDVTYENIGIEQKMLCYRSDAVLDQAFGTTLMHPAATRSIRIPSLDVEANDAMLDILNQYADLIRARRARVEKQNRTGKPADVRIGWLLWQESLRQFLYFEEPMVEPNPTDYFAQWNERPNGKGRRKGSKNLWIFEKHSGRKRYSVTTSAGAKIQPYFDVPPPDDPNVYLFTVIGEKIEPGTVRVWLTMGTALEVKRLVGSLDAAKISDIILKNAKTVTGTPADMILPEEKGISISLQEDAYLSLINSYRGVSDEHCFRLFLEQLQTSQ